MRRYFGTDGVRGIVGDFLTLELVERLGRAAALWTGAAKVFVGRDTRASGVELQEAFARGVISAGGDCIIGGVLPTPAVALLALDLGVVISASHNPPEYNGVKFFDSQGHKLADQSEEQIEELLAAAPGIDLGQIEHVEIATDSYMDHILERFGTDLTGLKIVVDCANGAYSGLAPKAFEQCGATVHAIGDAPDGNNINVGCGATDLALLQKTVVDLGYDIGIAFDGDGDRMLAVDEQGAAIDGDQIIAVLALDQQVDRVAVTVMTNLGFHTLMREHGIQVHTTDVGDRYVLEALQRENGLLGGEQSGHIIYLRDHVTGDGLAAGLLLCRALHGRKPSEVAAVMPRFPQAKENVRVTTRELTAEIQAEVDRVNAEWDGEGRILVRPSGTEPLIRVLAEAENPEVASRACASIAALVRQQLG
ncbi:MAG TPA: phosphoglucosamine mutase [Gaiellaceae bacterium]|jgi:phosphoglucosamine mutase|nr:phosphoglucosamine mutase [Gaiellaceae bacterium]